jgi:Arc/MetJ-type ribon-helix-helix transcriptional regulator
MTVELKPETERLVQEEIKSGHFHTVDDLIVQSVYAWREKHRVEQSVEVDPDRLGCGRNRSPQPHPRLC